MMIIQLCGGLGNQLFQFAFGRYLKKHFPGDDVTYDVNWYSLHRKNHEIIQLGKLGLDYSIFVPDLSRKLIYSNQYIRKLLEIITPIYGKNLICTDGNFNIQQLRPQEDAYFRGFWQSIEYAEVLRLMLLEDRSTGLFILDESLELNQEIRARNSVCVHIRRGDYLTNRRFGKRTHNTLDRLYYHESIVLASEKLIDPWYYIFSDDIEWAMSASLVPSRQVTYIDPKRFDEIISFKLMLACRNYIIANSTYSWWPAFINLGSAEFIAAPSDFALSKAFSGLSKCAVI